MATMAKFIVVQGQDAMIELDNAKEFLYGIPEISEGEAAVIYKALCDGYNALDAIIQRLH